MTKNKRKPYVAAHGHSRGNPTVIMSNSKVSDDWRYEDTLEPLDHERPCIRCKKYAEWNEPDPCLGRLPNVKYACCGHGIEAGYVSMERGERMSLDEYCNRTGFPKPKELL